MHRRDGTLFDLEQLLKRGRLPVPNEFGCLLQDF